MVRNVRQQPFTLQTYPSIARQIFHFRQFLTLNPNPILGDYQFETRKEVKK